MSTLAPASRAVSAAHSAALPPPTTRTSSIEPDPGPRSRPAFLIQPAMWLVDHHSAFKVHEVGSYRSQRHDRA
jgi:hypothetical protein